MGTAATDRVTGGHAPWRPATGDSAPKFGVVVAGNMASG